MTENAYISKDKKRYSLGYFDSKEKAIEAGKNAERIYYPDSPR